METFTLNDYKQRPHTTPVSFEGLQLPDLMKRYQGYKADKAKVHAEHLAIEFYMLNAAIAELSQKLDNNQPLTPEQQIVLDLYYEGLTDIGHRIFFYLLLICTRESRHAGMKTSLTKATQELGTYTWYSPILGLSETGAVNALIDKPPAVSVHTYCKHLLVSFQKGIFGSSFGGPKWAAVAKPLLEFVEGHITMEMLIDTAWTLAHNTGPIFNKGMLFEHQDNAQLLLILDVQRAGMIPNLVNQQEGNFVTVRHQSLLNAARVAIPNFGAEPIDWQKVMDLGAHGSYSHKIKKVKPVTAKPGNAIKVDLSMGYSVVVEDDKLDPTKYLQTLPTEFVKIVERNGK